MVIPAQSPPPIGSSFLSPTVARYWLFDSDQTDSLANTDNRP